MTRSGCTDLVEADVRVSKLPRRRGSKAVQRALANSSNAGVAVISCAAGDDGPGGGVGLGEEVRYGGTVGD